MEKNIRLFGRCYCWYRDEFDFRKVIGYDGLPVNGLIFAWPLGAASLDYKGDVADESFKSLGAQFSQPLHRRSHAPPSLLRLLDSRRAITEATWAEDR